LRPASIGLEERVCNDDELSLDGYDGDLCGLSGGDELPVLGSEVGIVSDKDEGRHVGGLPDIDVSAAYGTFAFPLAGLSRNRGETRDGCGLLVLKAIGSGMVAMRWLAIRVPMHAMLVRIWYRQASAASAAISCRSRYREPRYADRSVGAAAGTGAEEAMVSFSRRS